jgi:hypothetical protein
MALSKYKQKAIDTISNGVVYIELESWLEFHEFLYEDLIDYKAYVWRGQSSESWKLEPTLDRILADSDGDKDKLEDTHLENFMLASRGRRGQNPVQLSKNEWWALGQHNGLATPLLDWTTSPFVAAYFAFSAIGDEAISTRRAIYALREDVIQKKSEKISDENKRIEFIRPLSDENPRLVNQSGLFTKGPKRQDMESWVVEHFQSEKSQVKLIKVTLPEIEREVILKMLNRMNINDLTLFPDLTGASEYCNTALSIKNY